MNLLAKAAKYLLTIGKTEDEVREALGKLKFYHGPPTPEAVFTAIEEAKNELLRVYELA